MDRLTFLRREYNRLWNEVASLNKKFSLVTHSGESEYLKLKKRDLLNQLDSLEDGIKELELHRGIA